MSVEVSRNKIIPGGKLVVPGEKFRLIEKEKQSILKKIFRGKHRQRWQLWAEERSEEFLDQFTSLNSTCFVRSKTSVKGKDIQINKERGFPKTSGKGTTY